MQTQKQFTKSSILKNQSIINKQTNKLQCSLHSLPFTLYCDRCSEPVCQKCTFIGPHHTTIHSLIGIPQAYERRVQELNTRLNNLSESREVALNKITAYTSQIQQLRVQTKKIYTQNQRNQFQIQQKLNKTYENIISTLSSEQQAIIQQLNLINDLGNQFETLSLTTDIDCIINYERIMDELKELIDKIQILLQKDIEVQIGELPKELSDIRLKLKEIESYQEMFKTKVGVIQELIKKLGAEVKKIEKPKIQYQKMLVEIDRLLERFQQSSGEYSLNLDRPSPHPARKCHFVCHFCGVIMDDNSINTLCLKNKIHQEQNTSKYYSFTNTQTVNLGGYCKKTPQISKFGTSRHYFAQPKSPNLFYKAAFMCMIIGSQVLNLLLSFLPQQDANLQTINNQSTKSQNNSFRNYLQLLLFKIITLSKIKDKDLTKLFKKQDIGLNSSSRASIKKQIGYCEVVPMQYILMEILGLKGSEAEIVIEVCDIPGLSVEEVKDVKEVKVQNLRNYRHLLDKINQINI